MDLDVYTGKAAHWDNRALQIIQYLLEKGSETYTYAEIAKALDIPTVEVSRYLRKESFERRDYKYLLDMKRYRPKAYEHYLNNHRIVEENGEKVLQVNFSKHDIFLMNCRLKNVDVFYMHMKNGRQMVYLMQRSEEDRINLAYVVPESSWDDLHGGETTVDGDYE